MDDKIPNYLDIWMENIRYFKCFEYFNYFKIFIIAIKNKF